MPLARLAALGLLLAAASAAADDPEPAATPPTSVAELTERHDRALLAELNAYITANPRAADLDQAYMALFESAIQHDWYAEAEPSAAAYLAAYPDGPVRPLAQIVATMARARAGQFPEALATYRALLKGLDQPDQEEFAAEFADSLAGAATAAGATDIARQVYEALLAQFDGQELRARVQDDLERLAMVGRPAPGIVAKDIRGKALRLSELKGKYVLIDFWATWCPPCVAELPTLERVYAKYHDRGLEIVSVSLDETAGPLVDFVKGRNLPWPQLHNLTSGADIVAAYGISSIPATFLVGPDGTIVALDLRGEALETRLSELLR